jgi:protein ImuB
VTVTVTATAPLGAEQGDLLAAAWRDPAAVDAAFERLRATLGAGSVVRAVARDEHRPEKAGVWTELLNGTVESVEGRAAGREGGRHGFPCSGSGTGEGESVKGPLSAARLLGDPESVDVSAPRGVPHTLWWRGRAISIAHAVGPERISGDWWKDPYARDYWRCESDELARDFLLFRDADGWRLQGWYD